MSKRQALGFANFDALARIKGIDIYSKNITILVELFNGPIDCSFSFGR